MDRQRIAFVLYDYPLGVSTMVINSIRLFLKKGFEVDIYINRRNLLISPLEFSNMQVRYVVYDDSRQHVLLRGYRFVFRKTGNLFLAITKHVPFKLCLMVFYPDIHWFSKWLVKKLKKTNYVYIMPVEYYSLLCLHLFQKRHKIVYFNMELMNWSPKNPIINNKLILKNLEYSQIRKTDHVVIPSSARAKLFSRINRMDINKINVLPVASMDEPIRTKSRYFRELFDIPNHETVVVYSGNFRAWAKCLEIIQSVKYWPKGFVLVMHTWNKNSLETPYFRTMKKYALELPIFFSSEYIEYDNLATALSSADIGLAFYDDIDSNFTEILFSSNKIGEYLKAGLAVICSDFPSLNDFVAKNKIGMAVPVENLPRAIKQFNGRLESYRQNALACYQEKYRFENYFEQFYEKLTNKDTRGIQN